MLSDIVALSEAFIRIKSDPENAAELQNILELALSQLKGFTVERFESKGVKSALVYAAKKRPKKFAILLNAHLDVIPGKPEQYLPRKKGNRLYGVGSMDMKSNAVCLISAFKECARSVNYPLALQLVTDEETGGYLGTKYQIDRGVRADFVIAGEPTNFNIVHRAKGVLCLKIHARGKTAHGAYPWRGRNAIGIIRVLLERIEQKFPADKEVKWATTVNVSRIETTNTMFNKIPDDCTVSLDIRFVPEDTRTILPIIKKMMPKECRLEVVANEPAIFVEPKNPYLTLLQKIVVSHTKKGMLYGAQGTSDARHFFRVGGKGVEFGPVGDGIGTDNEWADMRSLETYTKILREFLLAAPRNGGK